MPQALRIMGVGPALGHVIALAPLDRRRVRRPLLPVLLGI